MVKRSSHEAQQVLYVSRLKQTGAAHELIWDIIFNHERFDGPGAITGSCNNHMVTPGAACFMALHQIRDDPFSFVKITIKVHKQRLARLFPMRDQILIIRDVGSLKQPVGNI